MANSVEMRDMTGIPSEDVCEVRYDYLKSKYDSRKKEFTQEKTDLVFKKAQNQFLTQKEIRKCRELCTLIQNYESQVYSHPDQILVNENAQLRIKLQAFRTAHPDIAIEGL